MFNESQFLKERNESGLAHTFGMDFYPARGWNTGFTLSEGELENAQTGGVVDRRAVSVSGGRTSPDTDWQSKLEWREDTGAEQREQWVSTTRLTHRINDSWRIAARLNYADTDDRLNPQEGARFIEGNLGFAYRPWNSQRWGVFGRYTYLYDLASMGQLGGAEYDQRSQIVSLEGVYKHDQHWEFAGKLSRREGEVRMGRAQACGWTRPPRSAPCRRATNCAPSGTRWASTAGSTSRTAAHATASWPAWTGTSTSTSVSVPATTSPASATT